MLGDPVRWHPVAGFGRLALAVEARLWRPRRSAGALYAALLVGAAGLAGALLGRVARRRPGVHALGRGAALWTALGGRSLGRRASLVAGALERGDLVGARAHAQALVARDLSAATAQEVARATLESVAENTVDAVVAPLTWAAVAGPAGALAYRAANTLDAMVGYRVERYQRFGWAAARLDDVLTWPAARLGVLAAVCAAPVAGGSARGAWRVAVRDGGRHPSPNAGLMEAAFAGALGLRLGGANRYGDVVEVRPALGDGRAPDASDIRRAVRLASGCGLTAAAAAALASWRPARSASRSGLAPTDSRRGLVA